jgi:hypothetical protein
MELWAKMLIKDRRLYFSCRHSQGCQFYFLNLSIPPTHLSNLKATCQGRVMHCKVPPKLFLLSDKDEQDWYDETGWA